MIYSSIKNAVSLGQILLMKSEIPDIYTLVHREKTKVSTPNLFSSTLVGFGLGPKFSSDIAGDGPGKRMVTEDEYDPELVKSRKRKTLNLKRKRSKAERQADI